MTKASLRKWLIEIHSLAAAAQTLASSILNEIPLNDASYDALQRLHSGEVENISKFCENFILDYAATLEEGKPLIPTIIRATPYYMELSVETGAGKLISSCQRSDDDTPQVSILYENPTNLIDICTAEVKKGSLAVVHEKPEDNTDIDVYVWDDVRTEDYTKYFEINAESVSLELLA